MVSLRQLEPKNVLVSSDCGQLHNPSMIEAMRVAIQLLLEEGFTQCEIRTMFHNNAARLLYE